MKKLFAILLALVMTMSLATTAFAVEVDLSDHTYKAYQIFTGTQAAGEDNAPLGNIQWGSGVKGADMLNALKSDAAFVVDGANLFKDCVTAADVAKAISDANWVDSSAQAMEFAKLAFANKSVTSVPCENGITTLAAGYYLVVDDTAVQGENDVANLALLQLTQKGIFTIATKVDKPTVEKKVDDKNDSNNSEDAVVWQDSADYDIGDHVPFLLKAKLATIADYTTYKVVFHDTMSKGLTYDGNAVMKIYIDGNIENTAESNVVTVSAASVTTGSAAGAEGAYADGTTLTVSCNDVKALGATDNSVVTVDYTATLNSNAVIGSAGNPNKVYLEYSNNPNESDNGDKTGKTPEDQVIVFTYKVVVNKVDKNDNALTGAGFTLYKKNAAGAYEAIGTEIKGEAMTQFSWVGIDDGDYKLVETTTPAGYNTIADIKFTVSATHDTTWTGTSTPLTALTGNATTGDITFASNLDDGALSTKVVNLSGATLPETGGIGTQIFYAVGGILVLAAVVLLVSKKRMSNKD